MLAGRVSPPPRLNGAAKGVQDGGATRKQAGRATLKAKRGVPRRRGRAQQAPRGYGPESRGRSNIVLSVLERALIYELHPEPGSTGSPYEVTDPPRLSGPNPVGAVELVTIIGITHVMLQTRVVRATLRDQRNHELELRA